MSSIASEPSPSSPAQALDSSSGRESNCNCRDSKLQVFLGGSCNPTTWRQNVAIPYLETNGISYYNPQIDNWTPEVVDSEHSAKQNAKILLFVIDKQTRSTVTLVESAFLAGEHRRIVMVLYPFEYDVVSLIDTSEQTSNIVETRSILTKTDQSPARKKSETSSTVASSNSSTSSSTLITSCSSTSSDAQLISTGTLAASTRKSRRTTTTTTSARISSTTGANNCEVDQRSLEASHSADKQTRGTIKIGGEIISLGEFQELRQARQILQSLVDMQRIPMFSDTLNALKYVSFCLKDPCNPQRPVKFHDKLLLNVSQAPANPLCLERNSTSNSTTQLDNEHTGPTNDKLDNGPLRDIYLSADSDDQSGLVSTMIPILKEKGLTYNCVFMNNITDGLESSASQGNLITPWVSLDSQIYSNSITDQLSRYSSGCNAVESTRVAVERQICAINCSRVLLFVITNKCRGLSIMVLASHFMALFRNSVVLCIQRLEEPCSIGGETLTKNAIADYNRGRVYLCDYASKSQVPVFSTIQEAIECCSRKCQYNNKS